MNAILHTWLGASMAAPSVAEVAAFFVDSRLLLWREHGPLATKERRAGKSKRMRDECCWSMLQFFF